MGIIDMDYSILQNFKIVEKKVLALEGTGFGVFRFRKSEDDR